MSESVDLVLTLQFFQFCSLTAYVGPGIATGVVAAVLGVLFSMFLAVFTVLYYPTKRLFKRRRKRQAEALAASSEE